MYETQAACIAHSRCKFSVTDPLHASLDNGDCEPLASALDADAVDRPLIPRARVSSVVKGMASTATTS